MHANKFYTVFLLFPCRGWHAVVGLWDVKVERRIGKPTYRCSVSIAGACAVVPCKEAGAGGIPAVVVRMTMMMMKMLVLMN